MKNAQRFLAPLSILVATAMLHSCAAPTGHAQATETAKTMGDLRTALVAVNDAITPVSNSLTELLKDSVDATAAYKQFVSASDTLVDRTKTTQTILGDLRARGTAYFSEWEKQNAAITDPDIKKSAEARRAKLAKQLDGLTSAADEVVATYPPYLARIKDARTFLSNDLTKAGIKSIDSTLSHLINEGKDVQKSLTNLVKEIDTTMPAFEAAKAPEPPK